MNQPTHTTAAVESASTGVAPEPIRMPRRQRIGSAVASAVVSGVLFGSVVLGMTAPGDDGRQIVGQSHATTRA
jgi:hypothetical protein